MSKNNILLSVRGLSVSFFTEACPERSRRDGVVRAVQDVGFSIRKGRTFALVGESGCGKSVTALAIMQLIPAPQGKIVTGEAIFEGQNLLALGKKQMRQIRGNKIAMIFQEPMTSLNPVYTVGDQIVEAIKLHQNKSTSDAWNDAIEMLHKVGIANAEQQAHQYPHQMSAGMQQRVMIAMAISCKPALLIADEPTTALDVTIQAQILDLLDELQKQNGMSILLITHDLSVVAERADDVAVMYASRIVEMALWHGLPARENMAKMAMPQQLFVEPYHPYTRGLLRCLPLWHGLPARENMAKMAMPQRLQTIPGAVPDPLYFPSGCKFHPRCRIGCNDNRCQTVEPELRQVQPGHCVACWYAPSYKVGKTPCKTRAPNNPT